MRRSAFLAILAILTAGPSLQAQSIFSAGGFGVPVEPVDGRARALGGVGVGLLGRNPSLANPAELAPFQLRGLITSLQTTNRSIEFDGATDQVGGGRFPLLNVVYPLSQRVVGSIGYGGFLDQSWAAFSDSRQLIGSDSVLVRDEIDARGGIAQFRIGASYAVSPQLALGLAGGLYTGSLERVVTRNFGGELPGAGEFLQAEEWSQRAPFATLGIVWDPSRAARVGAAVTFAGELRGDGERDAEDFAFDLPIQFSAGASGVLAPRLSGNLAARWAGWSAGRNPFAPSEEPVDVWALGAGLEWEGASLAGRPLPIRFGYQRSRLPFPFRGETPTEWAGSLGMGLVLATSDIGPLATFDAGIERGSRSAPAAGLTENFWRFTTSLSVFGR